MIVRKITVDKNAPKKRSVRIIATISSVTIVKIRRKSEN